MPRARLLLLSTALAALSAPAPSFAEDLIGEIAAGVLLLVEDGRLSLADDVRLHIPELPDTGHRITMTRYLADLREVVKHRALAYEKEGGRWTLDVLLDNARGGGGALLTTSGDRLVWNEALTAARLGAFVTGKLHEPARLNNGRTLAYARGLFLDGNRGGRIVWHTGSAGGYDRCPLPGRT